MNRRILILAGLSAVYLLVAASPGAAQVGICSVVTAITSRAEKGTALNIAEFDENVFATRQICDFGLGDWPTAGELLDLNGAIFKPTTVTAFPISPTTDDYVIVLDDSVAGACDSAAGTATTGCRWTGSAWEAVGDGGAGGGEANTASNLGGGLANFDSKVSVDLRFNTFSSADFALATNLFTIGNNAVTNAQAADMATDTVKLRNATGTGDPEDVKISALTEQGAPVAGDFLLCETAAGDLRKCDVGDLPAGGAFLPLAGGTMTGDITMDDVDLILNSPSEDWRIFNDAGTFKIFNTTDVLSRFEIDLIGGTTINPSGSIGGDFTWQSNDNPVAFHCQATADGGAGRCGMATATPEHTFDVQATVAGNVALQIKTTSGEATLFIDAGGATNDAEIILQDDNVDRYKIYDDTSLDTLVFESEFAVNLFMLNFDHSTGAATFNENGTATADWRWESDTETNGLFCDATGAGSCGFGVGDPGARVEVAGDMRLGDATDPGFRISEGRNFSTEFLEFIHQSPTGSLINVNNSTGTARLDINPKPTNGTSAAEFRFFRNTNTTGVVKMDYFLGDNSATIVHSIRTDNSAVVFNENGAGGTGDFTVESDTNSGMLVVDYSGNRVGIGTASPTQVLHINGVFHATPQVTAPAICIIGDFYVDTSGAYCGCSVANTWENMLATGTCA